MATYTSNRGHKYEVLKLAPVEGAPACRKLEGADSHMTDLVLCKVTPEAGPAKLRYLSRKKLK